MVAPVYSAGSPGNVLPTGTSVSGGKTKGAPVDLSAVFEGQITCNSISPGTLSGTTGVKFEFFHNYGSTTTISGSLSAGATSITVASATGITAGDYIALWDSTTNLGEIVQVTNVSGTTLTVSATQYAYTNNNGVVYLIESLASCGITPGPTGGSYATSTSYSKTVYLSCGKYWIRVTNLDGTYAWTVDITKDTVSSVQ